MYGWNEYLTFQDAPDAKEFNAKYERGEIDTSFATLEELGIPASEDKADGESEYPFPTAEDDDREGEEWKGQSQMKKPSPGIPDDIDHPRTFPKREGGPTEFPGKDDIPW